MIQEKFYSFLSFCPFIIVILSLAIGPLWGHFWERWRTFILGFLSLITVGVMLLKSQPEQVAHQVVHHLSHDYVPFVVLVSVLYILASGVKVKVNRPPTPQILTCLLCASTLAAALVGTMGSSVIFIRPLLALLRQRRYTIHTLMFFVILAGNVGGLLSTLGDPPLFVGYLQGVDFLWPTRVLSPIFFVVSVPLWLTYWCIDWVLWKKEQPQSSTCEKGPAVTWEGSVFLGLIFFLNVFMVFIHHFSEGPQWMPFLPPVRNILRDGVLLGLAAYGLWAQRSSLNAQVIGPLSEVAIVFLGVFTTAIPVMEVVQDIVVPSMPWLTSQVSAYGIPQAWMYFLAAGFLSAFLDNAPTYLIFFHVAGGDACCLMNTTPLVLKGIATGSVLWGALTYIGNAPNMMIKAIAERQQLKMPSFGGYMARAWAILGLPLIFVTMFFLS